MAITCSVYGIIAGDGKEENKEAASYFLLLPVFLLADGEQGHAL